MFDEDEEIQFNAPEARAAAVVANDSQPTETKKPEDFAFSQWACAGNDKFLPIGGSVTKVPPGIYEAFSTPGSVGLERLNVRSDGLYELPDMQTKVVMRDVQAFWANESKYRQYSLLFKRGLLLHGPPGSGKTACIKLLMAELVNRGGIVILVGHVGITTAALKTLRKIEPERHIILVFEDIDEIINYNGEAPVLSMLDGEHNIDRVLNLATTNFPERLGARIINRPSRFDRRIEIGMPSDAAREQYLRRVGLNELSDAEITKWTADTKDMSIAHLRELVAAVHCLGQPYDEVLSRLKEMAFAVKSQEEFKRNNLGFKGSSRAKVE